MTKDTDQWRWVVLATTYFGVLVFSTCHYSVGALYLKLLDKFHEDELKTSITGTLNISLLCFFAPVTGAVCNRFGCRTAIVCGGITLGISSLLSAFADSVDVLIVTYGILGGIGNTLTFIPLTVILGYYFDKHASLIVSLVVGFVGFGLFISTPFTFAVLEQYDVSGGFMILGGVLLNMCVVGCVCRPSRFELDHIKTRRLGMHEEKREHLLEESTSYSCRRLVKSLNKLFNVKLLLRSDFLAYLISNSSWNYFFAMCQVHMPNFLAKDMNADIKSISIVMSCIGVSNTIGRVSGAVAAGIKRVDHVCASAIALLVCGVFIMLFPFYNSTMESIYLLTIFASFVSGFCNGLMPCVALQLVGLREFASSSPMQYFFCGIGLVTGPTVTGFMVDTFGTYDNSFILAGFITLIGGICCLYTMFSQKCKQRLNCSQVTEIMVD